MRISTLLRLLVNREITLEDRYYNFSANSFIRSRENSMTTDRYLFNHPNPEIKFLGEFKGEKIGQFEVTAYPKRNQSTLGLDLLSYFAGTIEIISEHRIRVMTVMRLRPWVKIACWTLLILHLSLFLFAMSHVKWVAPLSFFFPISMLLSFVIVVAIFKNNLNTHLRFFEAHFIEL